MRLRWAISAAICVLPGLALAQVPAPPPVNPVDRLAPSQAPRLAPGLAPAPAGSALPAEAAATRLAVTAITLQGNTALPEAALAPAFAGMVGGTVPLARVEEARQGILRAYRAADYPFAAVDAGLNPGPEGVAITFAVTEGFVAEVKLEGDVGPAGTQVLAFLERLVDLRPLTGAALERALLLANDIPGLTVRGTLRPLATEPGALQLVAQLGRRAVSGYFNADNRGFKYSGPWQGLLAVGANSFSSLGERTELSFFGTQDQAQWFVQGSEEAFLGGSGLRLRAYAGIGYTRPTGKVGLNGYLGETKVSGLQLSYPVIRSRPLNLYAIAQFDALDSDISTGFGSARARASLDKVRVMRGGWDVQALEARLLPFLPAATTTGSFRLHQGVVAFGATPSGSVQAARAGSDFSFLKVSGEVQRTQPLFAPFEGGMVNLQGLVAGQWTNDVLPTVEKFYLGGTRLGRGFYAGQVTGDRALGTAVELQLDTAFELPTDRVLGDGRYTAQFYLFRDMARAVETVPTDPNRRLSAWGGGVRLVASERVHLDLEGTHRVTTRPDGQFSDPLKATALFLRTLVRF